jgi:hypothetical protein
MSKYLLKVKYTSQGWAGMVANPADRFEILSSFYESIGVKLLDFWFGVDQGAAYTLAEGPESEENVVNILAGEMAVFGSGNVASIEGTRLVSAADAIAAMKKAKTLSYRPVNDTKARK